MLCKPVTFDRRSLKDRAMNNQDMSTQDKDIVVNIANAGNFSTFHNALKAAGLVGTYKGMGPFTLFAPTDDAFAKLPRARIEALLKDKEQLTALINLHVIRGMILANDLKPQDSESIQGGKLTFAENGSGFTVNGAKVSRQEIEASNGVIHGIDTVMTPKH
jgi:uncharacterized surface protein with fasciclin (FAS1) repeats